MTVANLTNTETPENDPAAGADAPIEYSPSESVAESAEKVWNELSAGLEDDVSEKTPLELHGNENEKSAEEKARDEDGRFTKQKKKTVEAKDLSVPDRQTGAPPAAAPTKADPPATRIDPPARLPVEEKERFNRLDPEGQRHYVEAFKNLDGMYTRAQQDVQRGAQQNAEVTTILGHYMPRWGLQGITVPQALTELCAINDKVVNEGPAGVDQLLKKAQITPQDMIAYWQNPTAPRAQPQGGGNGNGNYLTQSDAKSIADQSIRDYLAQQATQAAVSEINALKGEVSPNGAYVYRELHDDNYLKGLQPLVARLRETHPALSWGDVYRKAVEQARIIDGSGSPSPTGPRLSPQEIQTARNASVSQRPRGNGAIPVTTAARKGEKVSESADIVWNNLTAGKY